MQRSSNWYACDLTPLQSGGDVESEDKDTACSALATNLRGISSICQTDVGRSYANGFSAFGLPGPIRNLRRTENPRVDGSMDSGQLIC